MNCEIVSVGTELLMGQIVNTDARYLAERMSELGIDVFHITTVGDNMERVQEALRTALSRSDLVITTGGLGPTEDDLTKEAVAELLGLPMKTDPPSRAALEASAIRHNYELPEISLKQADFPEGARILPNRVGTAPGCIVEVDKKAIAVLPGPPREMVDMYEHALLPYLMRGRDAKIESRFLRIFGMGETQVQSELWDLFHIENPTLALYCGDGEVTARITVSCGATDDPKKLLDPLDNEIRQRLGAAVYAEGRNQSLQETVFNLMIQKGKMLALAESCTGGMLGSLLTEMSGASRALLEGHITYNDKAKIRVLGVSNDTLAAYGAVSAQCASEMAAGALIVSDADYALSITGIAGPDGGTSQKPVGTCYIGLADRKGVTSKYFMFDGMDRNRVRLMACKHALNLLRLKLLDQNG